MEPTVFSEQEIQQLRAETSGTSGKIHFNNAGSSLPPDVVVDTVMEYLRIEATKGGYETEYNFRDKLEHTYTLIARLINADKSDIALVENASIAWGLAFNGLSYKKDDEVITSEMEYVTNLIGFLNAEKTWGIKLKVIPNDEQGNFSVSALEAAITPKTRLIAITHIPSSAGNIMPVAEIGSIARKHNILYLVDACQSVGQVPVDVKEIGCDMLAATGRKYLRAPRGTGFLYVRKEIRDQLKVAFIDGHTVDLVSTTEFRLRDDSRRFEVYERSRALTLGLAKAVEYALNIGLDKITQRIQVLGASMRRQLGSIEGITVHDIGDQQGGIVTFSVSGIDSVTVKRQLAENDINVSVGGAKSTLIYMNRHHLNSMVRASIHYYNTEEEIKIFCNALSGIVKDWPMIILFPSTK